MLVLIVKVVNGWLIMALITMAILLISGQWYLDHICRITGKDLGTWRDSLEFFFTVMAAWPLVLIALPFRSMIEK